MSTETVVINASPFILLCKCDIIDLLPQLFPEVLMPAAVLNEIVRGDDAASVLVRKFEGTWLNRISVEIKDEVEAWNLGDGEAEVLSLILAEKRAFLALIDDRAARRCAETLGIRTLGTAGLLVLAKARNLLPNVGSELKKLASVGLYISNEIERTILEQAGEPN